MSLRSEDICFNLETLYEIVGEKEYIEITRMYGGSAIYIPTYNSTMRNHRNRDIIKRYNGVNASQLAREYQITTNQVRRIIGQNK